MVQKCRSGPIFATSKSGFPAKPIPLNGRKTVQKKNSHASRKPRTRIFCEGENILSVS